MSGQPTVQNLTQAGPPLDLPISPLLSAGWTAFKENWVLSLMITLLWWIFYLVIAILVVAGKDSTVAWLLFYLVSPLPIMGLNILYLRRNAKQDISSIRSIWEDITLGIYLRFLIGSILVGFLVGIGYFFLIIPGVYIGVCWYWWSVDLLYRKKNGSFCDDIWTSMSFSRSQVIRNWCSVFVLAIVVYLIEFAASVTFVGVFIAVPVVVYAIVESYLFALGVSSLPGGNANASAVANSYPTSPPAPSYGAPANPAQQYGAPADPAQQYGAPAEPAPQYGSQQYGAPQYGSETNI
eukprot:TRINITY_DN949_c0_g1_i2.p1 TRINITY_DN949_c0_g1~~TRINITY_DN949_c0_g1_i2.p1  ORF type:complete len:294 (+),score=73.78 TRINITY_DN949_c0_g1_i2:894-1775(+)